MDKARIRLKSPPPLLAPFVEYVTLYTSTAEAPSEWPYHLYKQIPHGSARVLFRVNYPGIATTGTGSWKRHELVVMGPMKTIQDVPGQGCEFIVITVRAGAIGCLLGVPAVELTDRILPLEVFWGHAAVELLERIVLAGDMDRRAAILEEGLLQRIRALPTSDLFVPAAAAMIGSRTDWSTLAPFYRRTGYSARQVERKFNDCMGFGPKEFARIARFKRLFGALDLRRKQDWTELALEYGYYDPSHLFRDFQKLLGQSPNAFLEDYRQKGISMPGTPQTEVLLFSNRPPESWFKVRLSN